MRLAVPSVSDPAFLVKGKPRDLSIDYLRTTLTLLVLAHHSSLAYTTWARFDPQHPLRSTSPVVDTARSAFFDYAENFNDVFFMSLMFFVSGLFVYGAIRRHGTAKFVRDRLLRLGLPFAFAVTVLMPIAYYASWQLGNRNQGFFAFYGLLARTGFQVGPPWFVWVLLLFDVVLATLLIPLDRFMPAAGRLMRTLHAHSLATFAVLLVLSGCLYLPLLARFGFDRWTVLFLSPFAFQIARIGLYALWFTFGVIVGAPGFGEGLLSRGGTLARHWPRWLAGCIVAYNALYFLPRWLGSHGLTAKQSQTCEALLWVVSCVSSSFAFLALFRGLHLRSNACMNSLTRSAYVLYLVHYVFITWTQRLMLPLALNAGFKFLFVFSATVVLSWLTAQLLLRVPPLAAIL